MGRGRGRGTKFTGKGAEQFPGGQEVNLDRVGARPASAVPLAEAVTGAVGTSRRYAREDHVHPLVAATVAGVLAADSAPLDVGSVAATGVDATHFALDDHVHKGVHSLAKHAGTALYGDVTLAEGSNVTLSVSANEITIAASSGSSGAIWSFQRVNGSSPTLSADNTKIYGVVFDDTTSRTLTLPAAASHAQAIFIRVKQKGAGGVGYHVVAAAGADTIEGAANVHVSDNPAPLDGVTAGLHIRSCILISDGSSIWYFLGTTYQVNSG